MTRLVRLVAGLLVFALVAAILPQTPAAEAQAAPPDGPTSNGDLIAYVCLPGGAAQICTIDPDDSAAQPTQVTNVAGGAFSPTWSPDGRQLAFSVGGLVVDERNSIMTIPIAADGSAAGPTSYLGQGSLPDWGSGQLVHELDARGTRFQPDPLFYQWQFNSGDPRIGPRVEYSVPEGLDGVPVRLTVTAEDGRISTAETTLRRAGASAPVIADFGWNTSPSDPLTLTFDPSPSETPPGDIDLDATVEWIIDGEEVDGEYGSPEPFTFDAPGTYDVTLRWTWFGSTSSVTRPIDVGLPARALPPAPRVSVTTKGQRLAYVSGGGIGGSGSRSIRTMNIDGSDLKTVDENPGNFVNEDPVWVPGQRGAVAYSRRFSNSSAHNDLDIMIGASNLTHEADSGQPVGQTMPAISPDGGRIAYSACSNSLESGRCVFNTTEIDVADLRRSGDDWKVDGDRVIAGKGDAFKVDPAWSPDGTRLAYADFAYGIIITNVDDPDPETTQHKVEATKPRERAPAWRPSAADPAMVQMRVVDADSPHSPRSAFRTVDRVGIEVTAEAADVLADGGGTVCVIPADSPRTCAAAVVRASVDSSELPHVVALEGPPVVTAGAPIPGVIGKFGPGRYVALLESGGTTHAQSAVFGVVCDIGSCPKTMSTVAVKAAANRSRQILDDICGPLQMAVATAQLLVAGYGAFRGTSLTPGLDVVMSIASLGSSGVAYFVPDQVLKEAATSVNMVTSSFDVVMMVLIGAGVALGGAWSAPAVLNVVSATVFSTCALAGRYYQGIADDPPDADFTEVAVVDESASAGADGSTASEVDRAITLTVQHQAALLRSLERAQGAEAAGDRVSQARQLQGLEIHATRLAELSEDLAKLGETAADELRTGPLGDAPFMTSAAEAHSEVVRSQLGSRLSPADRNALRDQGFSDSQVDALVGDIEASSADPALASTGGATLLEQRSVAVRENASQWRAIAAEAAATRAGVLPAPFVEDRSVEVPRNTPASVPLDAFDPYGGVVEYEVLSQPAHGTLSGDAGDLSYAPDPGYLGPDSFAWRASNSFATSPIATVSIEVLLPAPESSADEYGTSVGTTLEVPAPGVLTNDLASAVPMTAELVDRPSKGSVGLRADGSFTYTPSPSASGVDRFTYRARTPGSAASSPTTVTIRLVAGNRPPTAVADLVEIDEDGSGTVDLLANDVDLDGDILTVTGVRQPRYGAVVCVAARCTYTPPAEFTGPDSFEYTVSDGQGTTSTGFVSVTVRPVADAPEAVTDLVSIEPGLPVTVDVLANDTDPDGDAISFVGHGAPEFGSVNCTPEGLCTYTPQDEDVSADTFTYSIRDASGATAEGLVEIANEPPMIFSEGPLELIITGNTLSCSVDYVGDTLGSFFNDVGCGTFLATGGTLYGQTFTGVGLNPPQPRESYQPISQSRVLGAGTVDDPYRVVTKVRAGTSGIELTQTDSYVVGEESYRTDVEVTNTSGAPVSSVLYRGGDCQLGDSDTGFGRRDVATGAVACSDADGRILEWLPLTGGSTSIETDPDTFWDAIASQQPFPGTCRCDEDIDNAGGLSWALTVPAGASVVQSHRTVFSPFGYSPLTVGLTTSTPTVGPLGTADYALTVTNPNPTSPALLSSVTARLPAGFVHRAGTTAGATTADPVVVGRQLTWAQELSVPANGSVTITFSAEAADRPGTYLTAAGATAPSFSVQASGDTASVEVIDTVRPFASFDAGGDGLVIDLDGSASFDLDGTVVAHRWDFGDGTSGSGESVEHTYGAPGTYDVTLTVTDDDGATGSLTRSVVAEATNLLPEAVLSTTASDLVATIDGSASSDADGTIVKYVWDFGDDTEGWGPTVEHAFPGPGTYTVVLTVTDDRGGSDTATGQVAVTEPQDLPPTAAFTTAPSGLTVAFDGRTSDDPDEPGGSVSSYAWDFGDGGSGVGATPQHTYAADGTYPVTLVVTDRRGSTATVTRSVLVAADRLSNAPPDASIAPQINGLTLTVDGSGSVDPDGEIVSYEWDFGLEGNAEGAESEFAFGGPGTYPVRLIVTDDDGASASATVQVTVPEGTVNVAPVAGFTAVADLLAVSFDGSGSSDVDGSVVSWAWEFGDGSSGSGVAPQHVYAAAGTYQVTLRVTDDDGSSGSVTLPVTVSSPPPVNVAPVAGFTAVADLLAVSFDGSGSSDVDGSVVSWAWEFGDGSSGSGVAPQHVYAAAGTYQVTLRVTDDDGSSGSVTLPVTVSSPPPVNVAPVAGFTAVADLLAVSFDASASFDRDGSVASLVWTFGDGQGATEATPRHDYSAPGTYDVTLTVTDDEGNTDSATVPVTVWAPVPPGEAPPIADMLVVTEGLVADLDGTPSEDPDGEVVAYSWDFGDGGDGTGVATSHTYASPGTYAVRLTVTDDDGNTDTVTRSVVVRGPDDDGPVAGPPVSAFRPSVVGARVTFDGSESFDSDAEIVSWAWHFGDVPGDAPQVFGTGSVVGHAYTATGSYVVMLTVVSADGGSATAQQMVSVEVPPDGGDPGGSPGGSPGVGTDESGGGGPAPAEVAGETMTSDGGALPFTGASSGDLLRWAVWLLVAGLFLVLCRRVFVQDRR